MWLFRAANLSCGPTSLTQSRVGGQTSSKRHDHTRPGYAEEFSPRASHLHNVGASRFIFSVFGATASSHERITRKAGSFERTKTAMRDALAVGLTTELHFVPMANNYRELSDVAQLARQLGASRVSVLRLVPQGRAVLIRDRVLEPRPEPRTSTPDPGSQERARRRLRQDRLAVQLPDVERSILPARPR